MERAKPSFLSQRCEWFWRSAADPHSEQETTLCGLPFSTCGHAGCSYRPCDALLEKNFNEVGDDGGHGGADGRRIQVCAALHHEGGGSARGDAGNRGRG